MTVDPAVAAVVTAAALALALAACAIALVALFRLRALRRRARPLDTPQDVAALADRTADDVIRLRSDLGALEEQTSLLREHAAAALSRVGTVRYDAFEDMGGHLSFSTALLDEHGDGVVFTAINGRAETRTYAKPVTAGESSHNLSEEEKAAIKRAVHRTDRTDVEEPTLPRNWVRPVAGAT